MDADADAAVSGADKKKQTSSLELSEEELDLVVGGLARTWQALWPSQSEDEPTPVS